MSVKPDCSQYWFTAVNSLCVRSFVQSRSLIRRFTRPLARALWLTIILSNKPPFLLLVGTITNLLIASRFWYERTHRTRPGILQEGHQLRPASAYMWLPLRHFLSL